MTSKTPPALAQVMCTLDEMAAAARAGDAQRYRAAVRVAQDQDLTEEQMSDAYQWGRRGLGPVGFDWRGTEIGGVGRDRK